ncbi:MAG TPA: sigma-70 family RNA polymerase sigma factor [Phycisphaerae bacterium]|nr:sigma-70 family RNA polymerase sigma factor [Phycisphaerae bacterium]
MGEDTAQLVRRAAGGDAEAFSALVRAFKAPLHAYILSRVGDFAWADDLAQEAFVRAFECLPRLRDPERFAGWLRRIADNLCGSWFRQLSRDKRLHRGVADRLERPSSPAGEAGADEAVLAALSRLSPRSAEALTLRYCDGLTHRECGEFLGVSAKAVESRLRRARRELKDKVIDMTARTLAEHTPGDDFDDSIDAEIRRLVEIVGTGAKKEPLEEAERRLEVLFGRNLQRLADLIAGAGDADTRLAAMRMVSKLDLAGANQAVAMATGDDERVRLNALAAMPATADGKGVYLVLEAVHDSGLSDERKVRLLTDLIRRANLLKGLCPKHLLKRFALDALHYVRLLLAFGYDAVDRLAELLAAGTRKGKLDVYLSRAFAAFGTAGCRHVMPWMDSDDPDRIVTALKLAEAIGEAFRNGVLSLRGRGPEDSPEFTLLLRPDRIAHPSRVDREAFAGLGVKVAALADHPDRPVRLAAAGALGYFDDDVALAALVRFSRCDDPSLAAAAARSLGWRLTPGRVGPMVEALARPEAAVRSAAEGALMIQRMLMGERFWDEAFGRDTAPYDAGMLATEEEFAGMIAAMDAVRERVLAALERANMSGRAGPWRISLADERRRVQAKVAEQERRAAQSELSRRARAYHQAHPEVARWRPWINAKREHWLGVAAGQLPEDRPFGEWELNKLISGVGMDHAHIRRWMVDEGWMTRTRSVYRLTGAGRRAMRMEHAMAAGCERTNPHFV